MRYERMMQKPPTLCDLVTRVSSVLPGSACAPTGMNARMN